MNYMIIAYWLFENDIIITDISKIRLIYNWLYENYNMWLCDLYNYYSDNEKRKYNNCDDIVLNEIKNLLK